MALIFPLPDAPPVPDQDGDQWLFTDDDGCQDWVLSQDYLPIAHVRFASSAWYTVQKFPGMTEEQRTEAHQDMLDNSLRWHPSLSAAARNA